MSNVQAAADAPLKLFISYSHKDEAYRERLGVHLAALEAERCYEVWHDRKLIAGTDWAKDIDQHLAKADVVLLLVSPDLISSRYVWGIELEQALRQEAAGKTHIVSVILKPCRWHRAFSPLASRQALPPKLDQVKSVSEHPQGEDKAFDEVMEGLETLCDTIRAARHQAARTTAPIPTDGPAPRLGLADQLRLAIGRHPWRVGAVVAAGLVGLCLPAMHTRLQHEAEIGWRLLRVGDHTGAAARLARAGWWPGLDAYGSQAADLGGMLAGLGDDAQRRRFVPALDALEQEAPAGSPAQAYASYLRAVETFERGVRQQDPALWLKGTAERLQTALQIDPQLADAHALLATLLSLNCQHTDALAVMAQAKAAAADLTPPHYLLEEAQLLQRRDDPGDRQSARALFNAQHTEPEAQLAGALQDLDAARWPEARAALASAAKALQAPAPRPAWLVDLPGGPWLLGDAAGKRCAVAYLRTVADALADGKPGLATAWRAVPDCAPFEPDARALACAHLPDAAVGARQALNCPTPQPRVHCPAQPTPQPAS